MSIKLKSTSIAILSASLLFLAGAYLYTPSISADHGRTAEACTEDEDVLGGDKLLCREHAEKDQEVTACQVLETAAERVECLENIQPTDDGYDGGVSEKLFIEAPALAAECEEAPHLPQCFGRGYDTFGSESNNPIFRRLNALINFLSIGAGILITVAVVISGIMWAVSGGNPQRRAAAGKLLWNSGVAILLFVFGWALLNWLVPGNYLG